jgi:hypothetical protein
VTSAATAVLATPTDANVPDWIMVLCTLLALKEWRNFITTILASQGGF